MQYTTGDRLKLKGISGIYSTVLTIVPTSDKTITFNFFPVRTEVVIIIPSSLLVRQSGIITLIREIKQKQKYGWEKTSEPGNINMVRISLW